MDYYLTRLIMYWPMALYGAGVFVIGLLAWWVAVVVQNKRWRRVVLDGKYADDKVRAKLVEQKMVIKWYERELDRLRKERDDKKNRLENIKIALEYER